MNKDINIPEPHSGQAKILNHAKRFNVLQCGRRFGKTTLGLHIALFSGIAGKTYGWFSPTYKLMSEQWTEITRQLAPIVSKTDKHTREVHLINGGRIDFWSLEKPDAGRGRKYHGVIIDEASVVRDLKTKWEQDIRPTLTDYKGKAWILGTPKGHNYFHQMFLRGQKLNDDWISWRLGTKDNPTIPDLEAELLDAKKELPEAIFIRNIWEFLLMMGAILLGSMQSGIALLIKAFIKLLGLVGIWQNHMTGLGALGLMITVAKLKTFDFKSHGQRQKKTLLRKQIMFLLWLIARGLEIRLLRI